MCNEKVTTLDIQSIPKNNTPVYKLFKQKEYNVLKEHFKGLSEYFEDKIFYTYSEVKDFLIRNSNINMWNLLELPIKDVNSHFQDILNDYDTNKLANIYISTERATKGIEFYESLNTEFKGNLIKVVGELIQEDELNTIKVLIDIFSIKMREPLEITKIKNGVKFMVNILRSDNLSIKMPNFYTIFGRYINETACLIETISSQDQYYSSKDRKYNIYSYVSNEGFSEIYKKDYSGYYKSDRTMSNHIAASVLSGLIFKTKKEDIPFKILQLIENDRIKNKYRNYTDILRLPIFTEEYLIEIENKASIMVKNNFIRRNLCKDMVIADYGLKTACEVYTQLHENEKILSIQALNILTASVNIIDNQLTKTDYVLESKLIERLSRNLRKLNPELKKKDIKKELGKIANALCKEHNLLRLNLNKKLRLELNISDEEIPKAKKPVVYFRRLEA